MPEHWNPRAVDQRGTAAMEHLRSSAPEQRGAEVPQRWNAIRLPHTVSARAAEWLDSEARELRSTRVLEQWSTGEEEH